MNLPLNPENKETEVVLMVVDKKKNIGREVPLGITEWSY